MNDNTTTTCQNPHHYPDGEHALCADEFHRCDGGPPGEAARYNPHLHVPDATPCTPPAPYYQGDGIVLYHADCLDILPDLRADMVITDPPYNAGKRYGPRTNDRRPWPDWCAWLDDRIDAWSQAAPETLMFLSQVAYRQYARHGRREIDWSAVWVKPLSNAICAAPFMPHWEHIVYFGRRKKGQRRHANGQFVKGQDAVGFGGDVFTANVEIGGLRFGHQTPKPMRLLRQLIARTDARTILDPFAGSGTTLRAAKDLGRQAIGIEIEEEHCRQTVERLRQEILTTGA